MKVVILSFTQAGTRLGERIGSQFRNEGITCQNYAPAGYAFADILPFPDNPKELIREGWGETSFLFIGAVGIAVRYIAPYVKDKFTDSAVVVMDEKSRACDPTAVRTSRGCGRTFQSACSMDRCSSGTDNSDRCSGKICSRCFCKEESPVFYRARSSEADISRSAGWKAGRSVDR